MTLYNKLYTKKYQQITRIVAYEEYFAKQESYDARHKNKHYIQHQEGYAKTWARHRQEVAKGCRRTSFVR